MNEDMVIQNVEVKPNNKKRNFLLGAILVLIALAVGLYAGYKKVIDVDASKILKDGIQNGYDVLANKLEEAKKSSIDLDLFNKPVSISLQGKLNSDLEELKILTDFTYDIGLGFDLKNEKMALNVGVSKNNASLDLRAAFLDNKGYIKCDELFNKVIDLGDVDIFGEVDLTELEELKTRIVSVDELEYLLKSFKDMLVSNITKENVTSKVEEFILEGKEYKGKQIVLHIDREFENKILDKILADEKILDVLSKGFNETKEDIKLDIEDAKNDEHKELDVVVLTDGLNKILSANIKNEDNSFSLSNIDSTIKMELKNETHSFRIEFKDEVVNIKVLNMEQELFSLETGKNSATIKIDIDEDEAKVNMLMELKNIKTRDKEVSSDIDIDMNITSLDEEMQIGINGAFKVSTEELDMIDTSGAVSIDSLEEAEQAQIIENLTTILKKFELEDLLSM